MGSWMVAGMGCSWDQSIFSPLNLLLIHNPPSLRTGASLEGAITPEFEPHDKKASGLKAISYFPAAQLYDRVEGQRSYIYASR